MNVEITSEAFAEGARIPRRYTCEGEDVSPQLSWGEVPDGAKSIALIADDPDAPAGTWVHWVIYGLPPDSRGLDEGLPTSDSLPSGARQGTNDFGRAGYGGPCPPPGHGTHRYYFKLYALDIEVELEPGATKERPAPHHGQPHSGIGPAYGDLREVVARLKISRFYRLAGSGAEGRVAQGPRLMGGQEPATATSSRYSQVTA